MSIFLKKHFIISWSIFKFKTNEFNPITVIHAIIVEYSCFKVANCHIKWYIEHNMVLPLLYPSQKYYEYTPKLKVI